MNKVFDEKRDIIFVRHKGIKSENEINQNEKEGKIAYFFNELNHKENLEKYINLDDNQVNNYGIKRPSNYKKSEKCSSKTAAWYFQELLYDPIKYYLWIEYNDGNFFHIAEVKENEKEVGLIKESIQKNYSLPAKTLNINFLQKNLQYYDYPVLSIIRAQGTIFKPDGSNQNLIKTIFKLIINDEKFSDKDLADLNTSFLHYKAQEEMCNQYLRDVGIKINGKEHKLSYCTFKIGKSLANYDIIGVTNKGFNLYAQVTYSTIENDKQKFENFKKVAESIKNTQKESITIYFYHNEKEKETNEDSELINIENVFKYYKKNNPTMLKKMIAMRN